MIFSPIFTDKSKRAWGYSEIFKILWFGNFSIKVFLINGISWVLIRWWVYAPKLDPFEKLNLNLGAGPTMDHKGRHKISQERECRNSITRRLQALLLKSSQKNRCWHIHGMYMSGGGCKIGNKDVLADYQSILARAPEKAMQPADQLQQMYMYQCGRRECQRCCRSSSKSNSMICHISIKDVKLYSCSSYSMCMAGWKSWPFMTWPNRAQKDRSTKGPCSHWGWFGRGCLIPAHSGIYRHVDLLLKPKADQKSTEVQEAEIIFA